VSRKCYGLPVRLPYIVITCARIDSIKRVCSEPPCCQGVFSELSSVHDSDTIKISVKALFLKISKTVCYNLVKRFLKNEESMRVTIFKLCANL